MISIKCDICGKRITTKEASWDVFIDLELPNCPEDIINIDGEGVIFNVCKKCYDYISDCRHGNERIDNLGVDFVKRNDKIALLVKVLVLLGYMKAQKVEEE
ncbi:MAG: hypothetical protein GF375_07675 [Candidatus Omnitrophica bacterium]|nr:hypothetical protein [Candidatus Omnitrophota bacterium]